MRKVLRRGDVTFDQIDVIELSEAFAAQAMAELHFGIDPADPHVTPNGGAIRPA